MSSPCQSTPTSPAAAVIPLPDYEPTAFGGPPVPPPATGPRAETGTTPHSWVTRQRVQAAEELLERTDHSVDWVAGEVGFGNAATLRHHFARVRGLSPQQYRRRFAG